MPTKDDVRLLVDLVACDARKAEYVLETYGNNINAAIDALFNEANPVRVPIDYVQTVFFEESGGASPPNAHSSKPPLVHAEDKDDAFEWFTLDRCVGLHTLQWVRYKQDRKTEYAHGLCGFAAIVNYIIACKFIKNPRGFEAFMQHVNRVGVCSYVYNIPGDLIHEQSELDQTTIAAACYLIQNDDFQCTPTDVSGPMWPTGFNLFGEAFMEWRTSLVPEIEATLSEYVDSTNYQSNKPYALIYIPASRGSDVGHYIVYVVDDNQNRFVVDNARDNDGNPLPTDYIEWLRYKYTVDGGASDAELADSKTITSKNKTGDFAVIAEALT